MIVMLIEVRAEQAVHQVPLCVAPWIAPAFGPDKQLVIMNKCVYTCVYVYVYIYIYKDREREI